MATPSPRCARSPPPSRAARGSPLATRRSPRASRRTPPHISPRSACPTSPSPASPAGARRRRRRDRKSTRLNSSHGSSSYAVFCLKKKSKRWSGVSSVVSSRLWTGHGSNCTPAARAALKDALWPIDNVFFFTDTATTEIYTLSLHGALPILRQRLRPRGCFPRQLHRRDRFDVLAQDRKSTRLNSSHGSISYAVFCLKKK